MNWAMAQTRFAIPASMAGLVAGEDLELISGGRSGCQVFRLRGGPLDGYLKHGAGASAQEVTDEIVRLRWLANHVSVPELVRFECSQNEAWLLTTALPGQTCFEALREHPQDRLTILDGVASYLQTLHAIPVESCPFNSDHFLRIHQARRRMEQGLVSLDDVDADHAGWSVDRLWQEMIARLPFAPDPVVTHGDFTLDNVIVNGTKVVGCIDVGRAGVADRYQDLALLWNYLEEFGEAARERFLSAYGISALDTDKLAFHLELDEFF